MPVIGRVNRKENLRSKVALKKGKTTVNTDLLSNKKTVSDSSEILIDDIKNFYIILEDIKLQDKLINEKDKDKNKLKISDDSKMSSRRKTRLLNEVQIEVKDCEEMEVDEEIKLDNDVTSTLSSLSDIDEKVAAIPRKRGRIATKKHESENDIDMEDVTKLNVENPKRKGRAISRKRDIEESNKTEQDEDLQVPVETSVDARDKQTTKLGRRHAIQKSEIANNTTTKSRQKQSTVSDIKDTKSAEEISSKIVEEKVHEEPSKNNSRFPKTRKPFVVEKDSGDTDVADKTQVATKIPGLAMLQTIKSRKSELLGTKDVPKKEQKPEPALAVADKVPGLSMTAVIKSRKSGLIVAHNSSMSQAVPSTDHIETQRELIKPKSSKNIPTKEPISKKNSPKKDQKPDHVDEKNSQKKEQKPEPINEKNSSKETERRGGKSSPKKEQKPESISGKNSPRKEQKPEPLCVQNTPKKEHKSVLVTVKSTPKKEQKPEPVSVENTHKKGRKSELVNINNAPEQEQKSELLSTRNKSKNEQKPEPLVAAYDKVPGLSMTAEIKRRKSELLATENSSMPKKKPSPPSVDITEKIDKPIITPTVPEKIPGLSTTEELRATYRRASIHQKKEKPQQSNDVVPGLTAITELRRQKIAAEVEVAPVASHTPPPQSRLSIRPLQQRPVGILSKPSPYKRPMSCLQDDDDRGSGSNIAKMSRLAAASNGDADQSFYRAAAPVEKRQSVTFNREVEVKEIHGNSFNSVGTDDDTAAADHQNGSRSAITTGSGSVEEFERQLAAELERTRNKMIDKRAHASVSSQRAYNIGQPSYKWKSLPKKSSGLSQLMSARAAEHHLKNPSSPPQQSMYSSGGTLGKLAAARKEATTAAAVSGTSGDQWKSFQRPSATPTQRAATLPSQRVQQEADTSLSSQCSDSSESGAGKSKCVVM